MKTLENILNDTRVIMTNQNNQGIMGYLNLRSGKQRAFCFVAGYNEDGWEHVSVSVADSGRKMPTWEEMCEVKSIFWRDDEEVHQIHPRAKDYFHGIGDLQNVLHLWRPVDGWKD